MLEFFDTSQFMPHGHCYLWNLSLLTLHVTTNAIVALAYFSIPMALLVLVRKRKDFAFNWMYIFFAVFILACGATHVMDVVTIWKPYYWFDGAIRAVTALASVGTAILMWPLIPKIVAMPSARSLAAEVEERKNAEEKLLIFQKELERLVVERTAELEKANAALKLEVEKGRAVKIVQARLAAMVETSEDAIIGKDLLGNITSWNRGAENIFGYKAQEVLGKPINILFPKDSQNNLPVIRDRQDGDDQISHYEAERLRKDGKHIFLSVSNSIIKDADGKVCGVAKIARDITERKVTEDRIRRWEHIFKHAGWAVAIIHPDDEVIEEANPAFAQMHGFTVAEIVGQAFSTVIAPEEFEKLPRIAEQIETLGNYRYELVHVRKDGSKFPVMSTVNVFKDREGKEQFRAATFLDITEQKDHELRIESAISELLRSNTDLEQFSYVASHDLQEPLRKMSSFSELLAQEYSPKLDGEALDYLNFIVDGAKRMQKLIDDLLEFSRIGINDSNKQILDLNVLTKQVISTLELQIEECGAQVTFDELPVLYGNASDLSRLFQNLLTNALKYRSEKTPLIQLSCTKRAKDWLFVISDNGIGIDPRHLHSIFVIFKRLHGKNKYPGTGIGLAICKKVVERHGGKIWAESNGNDGTRFCFTLPIK